MQAPHRHHGRSFRAEHDLRRASRVQATATRPAAESSQGKGDIRLPYDDRRGGYVSPLRSPLPAFPSFSFHYVLCSNGLELTEKSEKNSLRNGSPPSNPRAATSTPSTTKPPSPPPPPLTPPAPHPPPRAPER